VFSLLRDPKDEPYIDLAVAAKAACLVTWNDRHLTYLMRQDTPEGIDFCRRFSTLQILTPPAFLAALKAHPQNP
jgi:predicted nucleic acid-binding protein